MLFIILTSCPEPTPPQCVTSSPIIFSNGSSTSNTAGSAPTIILNVPASAAARVLATGASENSTSWPLKRWSSSRASATGDVPRSTTMAPAFSIVIRPVFPKQKSRTASPSGRDRNTTSEAAICASETARPTPSCASRIKGSSRLSNAVNVRPDLVERFRHMGSPITPRPIKPIFCCLFISKSY